MVCGLDAKIRRSGGNVSLVGIGAGHGITRPAGSNPQFIGGNDAMKIIGGRRCQIVGATYFVGIAKGFNFK